MPRFVMSLLTVAAMAAGVSVAHASTIQLSWGPDVFTPSSTVTIAKPSAGVCTNASILSTCEEFTYVHDLTDNGLVPPLDPSITLTGGTLDLLFSDGSGDQMKLTLEGMVFANIQPVSRQFTNFTAIVLASLAGDGLLNVKVEHQGANNTWFNFLGSTFTVYGEQLVADEPFAITAVAAVPEPASLLLFGTGLGALAMRVRRRRSSQA